MAVVVGYCYWPYYLSFAGYPTSCDIVNRHLLTARFRRHGNGKPSSARPKTVRPRFFKLLGATWRAFISLCCVRQCIKHIEPLRKHLQIRNNPVSYADIFNGISGTLSFNLAGFDNVGRVLCSNHRGSRYSHAYRFHALQCTDSANSSINT